MARPRAVVTGGAGFLGSHLCERLLLDGWSVLCLDDLSTGAAANVVHLADVGPFELVRTDVTEVVRIDGPVEAVLHFASPASPFDYLRLPIETLRVGSVGTLHALDLAEGKQARFLLASTSEAYGDPQVHPQPETYWGHVNPVGPRGVYDEAKRFAEATTMAYRRARGVDTAIVRIFNTHGPRMRPDDGRAVPTFVRQALAGEPLTIAGDGSQTRSIQYVDDLVEGVLRMLGSTLAGPVNIGNPHEVSITELAALVCELTGSGSEVVHVPRPRGRPDRPAPGHHAGPHRARVGAAGRARRRPAPHDRLVPAARGPVRRQLDRMSAASGPGHGRRAEVVVVGAGPAGLTAARELARHDVATTVLEADGVVGGISRTVERDGWRFDIGGHRFFTKVPRVRRFWHEVLPDDDFLVRPRRSRILYRGRFYDYPLRPLGALRNLGAVEAARCAASYVRARIRPPADQSHLAGWVAARFGERLYRHFFQSYNEKVWGVPATAIRADWAAQRIKNLSLGGAVLTAFGLRRGATITSLIERFHYPRLGPGMMWERCRELVEAAGCKVHLDRPVTRIRHEGGRAVQVETTADGAVTTYPCTHVVSSMPLADLLRVMDPPVPAEVRAAADALRFRDFLTVALVVPDDAAFPDNWIYVHSPEVRVGRIQNFGAWSPDMVKPGHTCLGLEYFVFAGGDLWELPDAELVALGTRELAALGLVEASRVQAGYVVRMPKAYPVYDEGFAANVAVLRDWLAAHAPNVLPVGRNGMHRYNNQDHSMLTAMLAVENIVGLGAHDVWSVNVEGDYHEESRTVAGTGRDAPVLPPVRHDPAAARG